jgi:hypothetical protein
VQSCEPGGGCASCVRRVCTEFVGAGNGVLAGICSESRLILGDGHSAWGLVDVSFLMDVSGVYVAMSSWSRVWCRLVRQAVGVPIACAVCVLSLSAPAIVLWLTCVAMCGCAAPMCSMYVCSSSPAV